MIITIDGPAGTGKSSVAKKVAEKLSLPTFDTGAMYRSVTLLTLESKRELPDILKDFHFEIREGGYFVNDREVTQAIRSKAVTDNVSQVAALPLVREALWDIQRSFAKERGGVFEGRDMGSVVFPEADIKIFLTASPEVRAQRRLDELLKKNPKEAQNIDREAMVKELARRDDYDSQRELAPLICPEGAHIIDTSHLTLDEVVGKILELAPKPKVKLLYRLVCFVTKCLFKLLYRHKAYHLAPHYPRGAIIAANHSSFLDPPLLAISWPEEVHFLARKTLFKPRPFGAFLKALNAHPISGSGKDTETFKTLLNLIREGKKVILFPEGTRSSSGELLPLKPGLSLIVSRTESAVIPAYIEGTQIAWGKKSSFPKPWGKTRCFFGKPILWSDFKHLEREKALEALTQKVREAILKLRDDAAKMT